MPLIRPACRGLIVRSHGFPRPTVFPRHSTVVRFNSTTTNTGSAQTTATPNLNNKSLWRPPVVVPRQSVFKFAGGAAALGTGIYLYNISDTFRHNVLAVQRVMVAAEAVVVVGVDYKYTMDITNRGLIEGNPEDDAERALRMSALHTRSANRLREMLSKNGGIYIKLVSFGIFGDRTASEYCRTVQYCSVLSMQLRPSLTEVQLFCVLGSTSCKFEVFTAR